MTRYCRRRSDGGPITTLDRYCPLCEEATAAPQCETHHAPTVPLIPAAGAAEPALGDTLSGRYRLVRVLGEGGMGRVYVAVQLAMAREVALKTLRPDTVGGLKLLKRFYREARSVSQLQDPHVVRTHDFGVDERTGTPYLVMELVSGGSLAANIPKGVGLGWRRATRIASQIARALTEAHAAGIVHRDLKCENVILSRTASGEEHARVLDFGIAKLMGPDTDGSGELTVSGAPIGTPRTMAPEQILCEAVDGRTDLYALGCILHELIVGTPPFGGESRLDVVAGHLTKPPPPIPGRCDAPPAVHMVLDRLLRKRPAERPRSAAAVVTALDDILAGRSVDISAALDANAPGPESSAPVQQLETLDETDFRDAVVTGTALEEAPERHRGVGLWIGLAIALAGAAAVAMWPEPVTLGAGERAPGNATTPAVAVVSGLPAPRGPAAPTRRSRRSLAKPRPTRIVLATHPIAGVTRRLRRRALAVPDTVSFRLVSRPVAAVFRGADRIALKTPYTVTLPADGDAIWITLKAGRHRPRRLQIGPDKPPPAVITLVPLPARVGGDPWGRAK